MAFIIHRRSNGTGASSRPRLILVGGDGRWVHPFIKLTQHLGFSTLWLERQPELPDPERFFGQDIVMVADPRMARWVMEHRPSGPPTPMVVITGSLLALSKPISREVIPLPWPITRENLETALHFVDKSAP